MTQQNDKDLTAAELEALRDRYEALAKELAQAEYAAHLAKKK